MNGESTAREGTASSTAPERRAQLFSQATSEFAGAMTRVVRAYEIHAETRRDLLQDMQIALWNSLDGFDGRCSLRTWVYRVAHNIGAKHALKQARAHASRHIGLDDLEALPAESSAETRVEREHAWELLLGFIQRLRPLDRQAMTLYLEDLDAAAIADITGLSPENVATKIHRIKRVLARHFTGGREHE